MILGIPIADYGPAALVSVFVVLLYIGGVVPRWVHKQRVGDKDDQITYLRSMVDKRDEQFEKLLTQGELNTRLLEDLKEAASRTAATGSGHT